MKPTPQPKLKLKPVGKRVAIIAPSAHAGKHGNMLYDDGMTSTVEIDGKMFAINNRCIREPQ